MIRYSIGVAISIVFVRCHGKFYSYDFYRNTKSCSVTPTTSARNILFRVLLTFFTAKVLIYKPMVGRKSLK